MIDFGRNDEGIKEKKPKVITSILKPLFQVKEGKDK